MSKCDLTLVGAMVRAKKNPKQTTTVSWKYDSNVTLFMWETILKVKVQLIYIVSIYDFDPGRCSGHGQSFHLQQMGI